ncbi:MAG: zinc-ribbon domain-containing protein [Myxococcales bacterium]
MDVRCDRCQTEYEFDEARLTEAGVAVKCTACGNVFKVRKPAAAAPIALDRPREWKVRREGQVYALKDLPELQRWIVERRVSREDEVSLSGDAWRKLGSMPELASFFEVVEAAEQAQRLTASQAAPAPAHTTAPTVISPAAPDLRGQGSASWEGSPQALLPGVPAEPGGGRLGSPSARGAEPAWTASPSISAVDDDLDADELRHVRPSRAPLVFLVLLALAALGGGGYYFYGRKLLEPASPPSPVAATGPAATGLAATGSSAPAVAVAVAAPSGPSQAATPKPPPASPTLPSPAGPTPAPSSKAESGKTASAQPEAAKPTEAKPSAKVEAKPETAPPSPHAEAAAPAGHDFNWYLAKGHKLLDSHPSQALALFDQAAAVNPTSPEPDSGKGIAYSNLEQWPKAIAAFQAALKKSPEFTEAIMGLAEAYRYKGEKREAKLYYKRYLELTPDGPDAPAAKAQIEQLQ